MDRRGSGSGTRTIPNNQEVHVANTDVDAALWQEFHDLVNMSSRELGEWLAVEAADTDAEELPDRAGPETGRHVLAVLGKRRADLTRQDIELMEQVVATIRAERGEEPEPTAGDPGWRHRLMNLGHDPLKPVGA
jgi:hypothetical protein